jgi:hypothetical protein
MMAKAIRNMQVPAYCPVVAGFQDEENSAVVVPVKKVMVIWSILIGMPGVELSLDEGMAMPAVAVGDDGIAIDISILNWTKTKRRKRLVD